MAGSVFTATERKSVRHCHLSRPPRSLSQRLVQLSLGPTWQLNQARSKVLHKVKSIAAELNHARFRGGAMREGHDMAPSVQSTRSTCAQPQGTTMCRSIGNVVNHLLRTNTTLRGYIRGEDATDHHKLTLSTLYRTVAPRRHADFTMGWGNNQCLDFRHLPQ